MQQLQMQVSYKFTTSFPYLLNRVGVRMGELFSKRLIAFDITLPMYRVMATLKQEGPQRLGELSDMTTTELSTLSRLIGTMKQKGLVSRTRPEENARTVRIELTEEGERLVAELMPIAAEFEKVAVSSFSDEEVASMKESLRQIYRNLELLR